MHTFRKILIGVGIAGALSLSVIWGTNARSTHQSVSAVVETIQKPGHVVLGDIILIQKPGH